MDGYGVQAVLAPLFKMVEALLELFVPIVMKNIIDFGIVSGSIHVVYRDCGLLILLGHSWACFFTVSAVLQQMHQ